MSTDRAGIALTVDGVEVVLDEPSGTLLDALRHQLGVTEVKDGCSPQGQCGCCTVLVDGQPRVACVTPVRRVAGRRVTTLSGLDDDRCQRWAECFTATGASQCGFCTPGIIVRLDATSTKLGSGTASAGRDPLGREPVGREPAAQALLAHLCRCTGWQTILEAWDRFHDPDTSAPPATGERDLAAAARRAELEGGVPQQVGPAVALGRAGFSADEAPADALVAVSDGQGGWSVAETVTEARAAVGKVQGRRTTASHTWPLAVPPPPAAGEPWATTLRTTWVEPAYLETDAAWCRPGGEPSPLAANGGAFGAKASSPVSAAARTLADRHQRPVLVLGSREDATRWGAKRPPVAGGAAPDGTGVLRIVTTPGVVEAVATVAPGLEVIETDVAGPPTSAAVRAAGWAEAAVLVAGAAARASTTTTAGRDQAPALGPPITITAPNGATASAQIVDGTISVSVACGDVLDEVVLRSYCVGAAHMAWSWVTSEALTVDDQGQIHDLTIRSFGVVRAVDTPPIRITLEPAPGREPVNGSDAVFAAVAAATWAWRGWGQDWPLGLP